MSDSLASVSSWRVKPGHERDFEALGDELMAAGRHMEGHVSGTVLHEDGLDEYHMVHSFRTHADLAQYLDSPERLDLLKRIEGSPTARASRTGSPASRAGSSSRGPRPARSSRHRAGRCGWRRSSGPIRSSSCSSGRSRPAQSDDVPRDAACHAAAETLAVPGRLGAPMPRTSPETVRGRRTV